MTTTIPLFSFLRYNPVYRALIVQECLQSHLQIFRDS
jgi:hypothetical protein